MAFFILLDLPFLIKIILLNFFSVQRNQSLSQLKNMRKSHKNSKKYWSDKITKNSNALDLEPNVFTFKNPRKIALSLKISAEESKRRKAKPFQSAMSMLNFYINRAGKNLPKSQRKILEQAKTELRKIFNRKLI